MGNANRNKKRDVALAKAIREACVNNAQEGFRDASIQGLCTDGAMEAAVSAIQMMNIENIIVEFDKSYHETTNNRVS